MSDEANKCELCGEPVDSGPWLLLNRFGVGSGRARALSERRNDDGEYLWRIYPGEDDREGDERATGPVLHWPICAKEWIEGLMKLCDFEVLGVV